MIRAMRSTLEDFDVFFQNSVVAVGWSDFDFTRYESFEALLQAITDEYYSDETTEKMAPQIAGKRKNEIRRFKGIQKGDQIVIPYLSNIRLAVACGEERFSELDGDLQDMANQHVVSFVRDNDGGYLTVPRQQFSEGLQRRLRVPGSAISDLSEFAEEVACLFQDEPYTSTILRVQNEQERGFKEKLLCILQNGTSALCAGGIGMEDLVAELLRADGYIADIQAKNRFPGIADADIEATRDDHITSTKLLVQVKHHSWESDEWGARQLIHILEAQPDFFAEYQLVLVTSGDASGGLRDLCDAENITLITGPQLVDWIVDQLENITPKMKSALRISNVPQLVEGELME